MPGEISLSKTSAFLCSMQAWSVAEWQHADKNSPHAHHLPVSAGVAEQSSLHQLTIAMEGRSLGL